MVISGFTIVFGFLTCLVGFKVGFAASLLSASLLSASLSLAFERTARIRFDGFGVLGIAASFGFDARAFDTVRVEARVWRVRWVVFALRSESLLVSLL